MLLRRVALVVVSASLSLASHRAQSMVVLALAMTVASVFVFRAHRQGPYDLHELNRRELFAVEMPQLVVSAAAIVAAGVGDPAAAVVTVASVNASIATVASAVYLVVALSRRIRSLQTPEPSAEQDREMVDFGSF